MQHIAILDDDPEIREMLGIGLQEFGFDCVCAATVQELSDRLDWDAVSLLIVDMRLGNVNGLDVIRDISQRLALPTIMISGYGDSTDRTIALEVGADDFVVKPFDLRELVARIRTVLRRSQAKPTAFPAVAHAPEQAVPDQAEKIGDLFVDLKNLRILDTSGGELGLTSLEFQIFEVLYERKGQPMSRKQILDALNMDSQDYVDRNVDVLILRLRKKIESNPKRPRLIRTVRNIGYVLSDGHDGDSP
ncbi:MAG: response regulator transcription factor [Rhodobacteraceae bacterium]|nr:response regulator transcription factor [Paracoccaceae bacterium]